MSWQRLYITVEGQTERSFAKATLTPHLAGYEIEVKPRVVLTNRKLGARGGILNFSKVEGDLRRLMSEDLSPEARFTTMLDFYALPHEFPGWAAAQSAALPIDRVKSLEQSLRAQFSDPRFHPYIQLHEFEALLYCDLRELQIRIPHSEKGIQDLRHEVASLHPEDINEGASTAPSKRIIRHLPVYEHTKVRVGAPAAAAIGLPTLRAKCPHFHDWMTQLERRL